jgi:hypothetical protein
MILEIKQTPPQEVSLNTPSIENSFLGTANSSSEVSYSRLAFIIGYSQILSK